MGSIVGGLGGGGCEFSGVMFCFLGKLILSRLDVLHKGNTGLVGSRKSKSICG